MYVRHFEEKYYIQKSTKMPNNYQYNPQRRLAKRLRSKTKANERAASGKKEYYFE